MYLVESRATCVLDSEEYEFGFQESRGIPCGMRPVG
jgi:hypothetical protein